MSLNINDIESIKAGILKTESGSGLEMINYSWNLSIYGEDKTDVIWFLL